MMSSRSHNAGGTTLLVTTRRSQFPFPFLGLQKLLLAFCCFFTTLDEAFGFNPLPSLPPRSSLSSLFPSKAWIRWSHQDSFTTTLPPDPDDNDGNDKEREIRQTFNGGNNILSTLVGQGLSPVHQGRILTHLQRTGLLDENDDESLSSSTLILLAQDFVDRPEVFSSLLISDFGFPPLVAHQTRALAMALIRSRMGPSTATTVPSSGSGSNTDALATDGNHQSFTLERDHKDEVELDDISSRPLSAERPDGILSNIKNNNNKNNKHSAKDYRATIVNERAKKRKMIIAGNYSYGLPNDYAVQYPRLGSELDDYYRFMTQPSTYSQEDPIRPATARVYLLHARLFLGWYINNINDNEHVGNLDPAHRNSMSVGQQQPNPSPDDGNNNNKNNNINRTMSLFVIIPNKEKESANQIIDFILWLRSRDASTSYEANFLRGIIKLLKFRFAMTSKSDPLSGKNTFDDIPVIKEVRKLHRDANKRRRGAPRSSDEQKKWITWPDYLRVVQRCKEEVMELRDRYLALSETSQLRYAPSDTDRRYSLEQQRVADAYQRYLILAIFASIPDRQRTIRELEVGRTLVKDRDTGYWTVKHGPDDYKTGKVYGERPAMQLADELTPAIDDFLGNYRPALRPSTNTLFVQSRTGRPMTGDSIFQRVTRACFKYTGRRTNPHMLRDIIVTHVRETDASEKELEALALFMGHSVTMQRDSYDRRTLTTKIAPAVKLIRSMNNDNKNGMGTSVD